MKQPQRVVEVGQEAEQLSLRFPTSTTELKREPEQLDLLDWAKQSRLRLLELHRRHVEAFVFMLRRMSIDAAIEVAAKHDIVVERSNISNHLELNSLGWMTYISADPVVEEYRLMVNSEREFISLL